MKIAILIAGEYREFKIAHKFWTFLKWPNVDCFFATWDKSIRVDKKISVPNQTEFIRKEDITDYINVVNYRISNRDASGWTHSSGFMIDRWKEAIIMMKDSGHIYDRVLLIRPDLALEYDEELVKNFIEQTPDDDSALYSINFGAIDQSFDLSALEQTGDLIMFGNQNAILNLLNLPMHDLRVASELENSVLPTFPPVLPDIHRYLGKNIPLLYKSLYNFPIHKNCVVRSNCRDLINPSFDECKLKAKEWWESRYTAFYDMTDNFWNHGSSNIVKRLSKKNAFNLWKNFDTTPWWEPHQITKWNEPDGEARFHKNFIINNGFPSEENRGFCPSDRFVSYSADDIEYRYNSYGFRLPDVGPREFEETLDYPVFAVAGCSVTEGIGLPENHIWHSQLLRKFVTDRTARPIAKFNLGKGGRSIDSCIRYLYTAIQHKNLKPDLVYLLLPPIARKEYILPSANDWFIYNFIPGAAEGNWLSKECNESYKIAVNINDRQRYHDAFKNLLLLKWFLESKGIPWFFSSWLDEFSPNTISSRSGYPDDNELPEELRTHYIKTTMVYDQSLSDKPFNQNIARDCFHYGPNSHYNVVSQIWDEITQREGFQKFIEKTQK